MKRKKNKKMGRIKSFEAFDTAFAGPAPAKPKTRPKTKPGTTPRTRPGINPGSDPMKVPGPSVNPRPKAQLDNELDKIAPKATIEDVIKRYNELIKAKKQ